MVKLLSMFLTFMSNIPPMFSTFMGISLPENPFNTIDKIKQMKKADEGELWLAEGC